MKTSVLRMIRALFAGTNAVATAFPVSASDLDNPRQLKKALKSHFHLDNPDISGQVALDIEVITKHYIHEPSGALYPAADAEVHLSRNQIVRI